LDACPAFIRAASLRVTTEGGKIEQFVTLIRISAHRGKGYIYKQERGRPGYSFGNGCKISFVSTGPQLIRSAEPSERNWLPLAIAAAVVLIAATVSIVVLERGKSSTGMTPISAAPDTYAASLPITGLTMSQSANLAGGKATYLDGHITNSGSSTVTAISVQVLFRNIAHEVVQNETQPLMFIRTRVPYVDLEPVSAAPLSPGGQQDFRLIFDAVSPDWDGAYPEIRVIRVKTK
jgi:hypothetical protein